MTPETIATSRTVFGIAPNGREYNVLFEVEVPTPREKGGWQAKVHLKNLDSKVHIIAGMDSWQAMTLAMRFVAARMGHFEEAGWNFYWEEGGDIVTSSQI